MEREAAALYLEAKAMNEREVRRRIVHMYRQQPPSVVRAIIEAKIADPGSFHHRWCLQERPSRPVDSPEWDANVREEVFRLWDWYLYCLTFESQDFPSDSSSMGLFTGLAPGVQFAVPAELDSVDLQAAAMLFRTQITVSRLADEAFRLESHGTPAAGAGRPERCAHLLHHAGDPLRHAGDWAPLLGMRPPKEEPVQLEGALVELGELPPGPLEAMSGHTAIIKKHIPTLNSYTACIDEGRMEVPIERHHIKKVLYHESDNPQQGDQPPDRAEAPGGCWDARRRPPPGDKAQDNEAVVASTALDGVPEDSLEHQLLQSMVRHLGCGRLQAMQEELAGRSRSQAATGGAATGCAGYRAPVRSDGAQQPAPQQSDAPPPAQAEPQAIAREWEQEPEEDAISRIPREVAWADVRAGRQICVYTVKEWCPMDGQCEGQVPVDIGAQMQISHISEDGNWVFCSKRGAQRPAAWCPADAVVVWQVEQVFEPQPGDPNTESYLRLRAVDDMIVVTERCPEPWVGWAYGSIWGVDDPESGVFPLAHVAPHVLVSQPPGG